MEKVLTALFVSVCLMATSSTVFASPHHGGHGGPGSTHSMRYISSPRPPMHSYHPSGVSFGVYLSTPVNYYPQSYGCQNPYGSCYNTCYNNCCNNGYVVYTTTSARYLNGRYEHP